MPKPLQYMQTDTPDTGYLKTSIISSTNAKPIENATVEISTNDYPGRIIETLYTDSSGQTESISLATPPLEYSMEPFAQRPYAQYNLRISAPNYETIEINDAQILSGKTAIQEISLIPSIADPVETEELFVIPEHTLYGDFPPKIAESEVKPTTETGEIVLSRVVIPDGVRNYNFFFWFQILLTPALSHF